MATGINSNLCLSDVLLALPAETVAVAASITTATVSKTKIVEHTVTTGKDFYILAYSVTKETNNTTGANPCSLEVETLPGTTTVYDKGAWQDGSNHTAQVWSESRDTGIKIATAGNKVQLYVSPGRTTATAWFGKIIGVERDA